MNVVVKRNRVPENTAESLLVICSGKTICQFAKKGTLRILQRF